MTRTCAKCDRKLSAKTQGSLCLTHFNEARAAARGDCSDCGKQLSRQNHTGRCRTCSLLATAARLRETEEHRALLAECGRRNAHHMFTPEARKKWAKSRPKVARIISERALGWCPPEYRDEYRSLMRAGSYNAASAKRAMLKRIEERRIAALVRDHLSDVLSFLRRYTAITLREDGYQYGNSVDRYTAEQLVQRAEAKGWKPQEWRIAA